MGKTLVEALEETMGFIEQAVARIEAREGVEAELHNIRAYLLNVLDLVERDPSIDAAVDDLHETVRALAAAEADERPLSPAQRRTPRDALLRLQDRLLLARPSQAARKLGLG